MLLAVRHHNAQFISLPFDGLYLAVHGAEIEHSGCRRVAFERLRHAQKNPRGQLPSQWSSRTTGGWSSPISAAGQSAQSFLTLIGRLCTELSGCWCDGRMMCFTGPEDPKNNPVTCRSGRCSLSGVAFLVFELRTAARSAEDADSRRSLNLAHPNGWAGCTSLISGSPHRPPRCRPRRRLSQ
jgi:hypothetical protein